MCAGRAGWLAQAGTFSRCCHPGPGSRRGRGWGGTAGGRGGGGGRLGGEGWEAEGDGEVLIQANQSHQRPKT